VQAVRIGWVSILLVGESAAGIAGDDEVTVVGHFDEQPWFCMTCISFASRDTAAFLAASWIWDHCSSETGTSTAISSGRM
jgi:hypothetical protein